MQCVCEICFCQILQEHLVVFTFTNTTLVFLKNTVENGWIQACRSATFGSCKVCGSRNCSLHRWPAHLSLRHSQSATAGIKVFLCNKHKANSCNLSSLNFHCTDRRRGQRLRCYRERLYGEVSRGVRHHRHHGAYWGSSESLQWAGGRTPEADELCVCPNWSLRLC